MTLEEKKKKLVQKLDILSEKELNYLLNFIEELRKRILLKYTSLNYKLLIINGLQS